MSETPNRSSSPILMRVELDAAWADDFTVDCYECGHSVNLAQGILLPASTYGDPEGDPPDSILVIHRPGECHE